jgi:TolA-binding protein
MAACHSLLESAMFRGSRFMSLFVVFCLGLGLAWVGWRVTDLAQQVSDLQGQVNQLSGEAQAADDALTQSQAAMQRVREATDELSNTVDALGDQDVREVLPALLQARQALQEAVTDAEDALGDGGITVPADDTAKNDLLTA